METHTSLRTRITIFVIGLALVADGFLTDGGLEPDVRHGDHADDGSPHAAPVISLAIYVILDLEFSRIGLIRIHGLDQVLVDLRQSMN